jgi:chromosome partitioning protein
MLVAFTNTKGGVGKSTLAVHLAVWLFDRGFRVAVLDCDKQRSSSQWIAEAEPNITVRTSSSPESTLMEARTLLRSHDFVIGDGPGGLDDLSRTLLILADLAILPITPSVLDIRSVSQATEILRYAQELNGGRPEGRLVLNKMRTRGRISREIREAAPSIGVTVAHHSVRQLEAFVDAAQQGSVVTRMKTAPQNARDDIERLCSELMSDGIARHETVNNSRRTENG